MTNPDDPQPRFHAAEVEQSIRRSNRRAWALLGAAAVLLLILSMGTLFVAAQTLERVDTVTSAEGRRASNERLQGAIQDIDCRAQYRNMVIIQLLVEEGVLSVDPEEAVEPWCLEQRAELGLDP